MAKYEVGVGLALNAAKAYERIADELGRFTCDETAIEGTSRLCAAFMRGEPEGRTLLVVEIEPLPPALRRVMAYFVAGDSRFDESVADLECFADTMQKLNEGSKYVEK